MSTAYPKGNVSASISAGPIRPSGQPINDTTGQMFLMGANLYIHIQPAVAAQWIEQLTSLAALEATK
jgi:hypothetical protein